MCLIAFLISRSSWTRCLPSLVFFHRLSGSRRIWPSHLSLRARIHINRLNVHVSAEASCFLSLPVMCDNIYAFAPFNALHATSSSSQASAPYVIMLQHPAMYSLSLRSSDSSVELRICRSCPALAFAMAILRRTSGM